MKDMYGVLPDIPRFYTALAEWLACLLCILKMKRRINGWKLVAVAVCVLIVQSFFLIMTDNEEGFLWILCMAIAVGIMYLFIFSSCKMGAKDTGYCCVRAFVLAEFMASLEWEVECFFYYDMKWNHAWNRVLWLAVTYSGVCLACCLIEGKLLKQEKDLDIENRELISCIIIGAAVFLMSNLGYTSLKTPFTVTLYPEIFIIRTMIDLGGIAILYAYHLQRINLRIRYEYESMQNILHHQYIQYEQSQEAIDLINYKYHDLKHYILMLKLEENEQKRNDCLKQMEEELKGYGMQYKTGNQVLDTLLTSKNLYCTKKQIVMTCVVDGALFDFMDDIDICSIFGNALDNAIECEEKIQVGKRLIEVTAFSQRKFLIIRFENYYEGELEFQRGLPITTKKETQFHGYGLKSLCYTVRKYGGEVDISTQENWFSLKILIPM
ncbi:hypothetical protein C806_03222 [Lachnospiraceae bacterium 3-1]|nr:hypothetical protein C806_03222 [Lachnospiraceae bacterium 3-1]